MSHQDKDHARINQQAVKDIFDRLLPDEITSIVRHGNATLEPIWLAAVAIVCWGWTKEDRLKDRVETACSVVASLFKSENSVSRQGLMKALASSGETLIELIVSHFALQLSQFTGHWSNAGKVNLAVDGTKFAAPRTEANQSAFSAVMNKKKRGKSYKKKSDKSKASSVQLLCTVFWHINTGLPFRWKIQGSNGSERVMAQQMIDQLPVNVRLIGDAEYIGYPLWSAIITAKRSFLFRVGSNVKLLKNLGKLRFQDGFIYYWPQCEMHREEQPIVLRLIKLHTGKKAIYLVSNELDMTDQQASELYKQRWGIEVFFRSVKQSCQRSKLCCGSPQNVITELNWTLLGVWIAMFAGNEALKSDGTAIKRLSPIKVMRAFYATIKGIAVHAKQVELFIDCLSQALLVDESERTSSKKSRDYPRKKKRRRCGKPKIATATQAQKQKALAFNV